MLGAFKASLSNFGGYLWKVPYKMSQCRKRHIRERLKNVENTLQTLNSLGIKLKALDVANLQLRYSNLTAEERYTYFSKKHAARRPVHFYRHYTKVQIPTQVPYGYK